MMYAIKNTKTGQYRTTYGWTHITTEPKTKNSTMHGLNELLLFTKGEYALNPKLNPVCKWVAIGAPRRN